MASSGKSQLQLFIFNDPTFAWELLEWEIAIEMNDSLSGQAIAHLLELYMRGVEKMNSLMDVRESYFKNKVTSLMMKGNVVKTLNKPPMAKKQKPLEVAAKKDPKSKKSKGDSKQQKKEEEPQGTQGPKSSVPSANVLALQQKRREIEMRLAYEADSSSRENLNNLYNQHLKKEQNLNSKIKNILNDHQLKLQQRISRRKLKTSTNRSRPEDTSDTYLIEVSPILKKGYEELFSPREKESEKEDEKPKRCSSLEVKAIHDMQLQSPTRKPRKNTQDLSEIQKIESDKAQEIDRFEQFKKAIEEARKREDDEMIEMVLAGDLPGCEKSLEEQELEKTRQSV